MLISRDAFRLLDDVDDVRLGEAVRVREVVHVFRASAADLSPDLAAAIVEA